MEKLAKVISKTGFCARRKAEALILAGRVQVDGHVVDTPKVRVLETAVIHVDGKLLPSQEQNIQIWRFYKPPGVLVSRDDPQGRRTIFDLLPPSMGALRPVGRLDFMSEGLLLLTNNGALIEKLTHPRYEVPRIYHVCTFGQLDEATLAQIQCPQGHFIEDDLYAVAAACRLSPPETENPWVELCLKQGKNRVIRKIWAHFHLKIRRLKRTQFGSYTLGTLQRGQYERLS